MKINAIFLIVINIISCFCNNVIDVDDILSIDYMPGALFMLENPEIMENYNNLSKIFKNETLEMSGQFNEAFSTMGFHRKMMNEYMCRNFVAQQIVSEMSLTRLKRRLGSPAVNDLKQSKMNLDVKNNLIDDEGSTNYKDWLTKSTTLEDIYRQFDGIKNREDDGTDKDDDEDDDDEEYTGHAYKPPYKHPYGVVAQHGQGSAKLGHSGYGYTHSGGGGGGNYYPTHNQGSGYGYSATGQSGYGNHHTAPSIHIYGSGGSGEDSHHHHDTKSPSYEKEKDLSDLFEIALTALAFLSFGMFIINVVMCISMASNTTTTTMAMMPMSMSPTGEPTGGGMEMTTESGGMTGEEGGMTGDGVDMTGDGGDMTGDGGDMNGDGGGMTGEGGDVGNGGDEGGGDGGADEGGGDEGGGDGGNGGEEEGGDGGEDGGGDGGEDGGGDGGDDGDGDGGDDGGGDGGDDGGGDGGDDGGGDGGDGDGGGGEDGGDGGGDGDGGDGDGDGGDDGGDGDGGDGGDGDGDDGDDGGGDDGDGVTGDGGGDDDVDAGDGGTGRGITSFGYYQNTRGGSTGTGTGTATGTGSETGTGTGEASGTGMSAPSSMENEESERIGVIVGTGEDTYQHKMKREVPRIVNPNNYGLNELARRVLTSIEAALIANQDNGNCLRRSLCENNKYSRELSDNNRMWIPVWSLGMSWLSGKLTEEIPIATSMLDSLKASILGLGKAHCEVIYQDCDLKSERNKRRRRRRKRSSN